LVFGRGTTDHKGNLVMAGAFSFHVAVVVGENDALMLRRLVEGRPRLPSLLDVVRNSSVESTVARYEVDTPLRVEPAKMAPLLPLLGDRLRPPK
jgi:hypothetical protein